MYDYITSDDEDEMRERMRRRNNTKDNVIYIGTPFKHILEERKISEGLYGMMMDHTDAEERDGYRIFGDSLGESTRECGEKRAGNEIKDSIDNVTSRYFVVCHPIDYIKINKERIKGKPQSYKEETKPANCSDNRGPFISKHIEMKGKSRMNSTRDTINPKMMRIRMDEKDTKHFKSSSSLHNLIKRPVLLGNNHTHRYVTGRIREGRRLIGGSREAEEYRLGLKERVMERMKRDGCEDVVKCLESDIERLDRYNIGLDSNQANIMNTHNNIMSQKNNMFIINRIKPSSSLHTITRQHSRHISMF